MMIETPAPAIGSKIPLLFTYRDTLFGNGFIVEVKARNGRALAVREADGFWMYGVNPGGMAARGDDPDAAHAAFRTTFSTILKDLADESSSFEEFRASVRAFFEETNSGYEPDWYAAVRAVRKTEGGAEGIPTAPADSPREIRVEMKQIVKVKAEDNIGDTQLARAA